MSILIGGRPLDGGESGEGHEGPDVGKPRPRILCVDHERPILDGLYRLLSERFDVVTSQSPVEALSLIERDGDFAVLIADLNMPKMNGLTLLQHARALAPTTTRLGLAGQVAVAPLALSPEAVFRIVGKRCPPETLLEVVVEAVSYHALLTASPVQPIEGGAPSPLMLPPSGPTDPEPWPLLPHTSPIDITRVLANPVTVHSFAPPSLVSSALPARLGLQMTGRAVELLPGLTLVGRSRTCHIPINDPHVSRRHACFSNDQRELTVRNLSSTNKLLLNGVQLDGHEPHPLQIGDRVTIGAHQIEICAFGDYTPSIEPTQRGYQLASASAPEAASEPATFGTLAEVAGKYVRLGQGREAERILCPLLEGLLRHCRAGQPPLDADVALAVDLALGIAETNRAGHWITYVFDLLSTVRMAAERDVLERLYRIIPVTPGISMASYRSYLEALEQVQDRWGPAQRFLIRRVQGLETAMMMSAHI